MITLQEASLIGLCLEGFLYGKMFILYALNCGKERSPIIPRSTRTLFRNIRYLFTKPIKQVQDGNHLLFSLSSLCSIWCYRCL